MLLYVTFFKHTSTSAILQYLFYTERLLFLSQSIIYFALTLYFSLTFNN